MLDFRELSVDGQDLELLTRELLFSLGYRVSWSGSGPDGGKDLICVEELDSIFQTKTRNWLIQCKHKAKSGRSVGVGDLDDITTSCIQHKCDGYLLVTTTQPSSAVVERLEQVTKNETTPIVASFWDAVELEKKLTTPQQWCIAQRFFPNTAKGWQIYASDRPNHWTANYKGFYLQLTNRIGSNCQIYLKRIEEWIEIIEKYPLPEKHFFRLRAVYFDDKHGTFTWYIDYMHPHDQEPIGTADHLEEDFKGDWNDSFDFKVRDYIEYSDHYDPDHYDFYDRYLGQFLLGKYRPK